ncbi:MAG: hypothetical protein ACHQAY_19925 [Hyphomicrobiales bacterium]
MVEAADDRALTALGLPWANRAMCGHRV